MIAVGLLAAGVLTLPGVLAALAAALLIQAPDPARLLRRRARALAPAVLAGRHLPRPARATTSPRRRCRSRSASAPTAAGTRSAAYTTLGLLAAVLALLVRMESVLVARRARGGRQAGRSRTPRPRRRRARPALRRLRRGARLLPVLPRVRRDRGDAARARRGAARPRARRPRGDARAGDRARARRGDHRRRAPVRDPQLGAAAVTPALRLRRADGRPAAGRPARRGRVAARASAASRPTSSSSATAASPAGVPDGVRVVALPARRRHPGRAQRGRRRTCAASCCSSSTTTPGSPDRDALARVAARVRGRSGARRWSSCAPQPRERRRRAAATGCRGCASATRRAVERDHGRLGGRGRRSGATCSSRSAAGRREFRFVHEGVDLGWRVMDAGYRMRYAGDIVVLHPSPAGTRARVFVLFRGAQPSVARAPPPAAAARASST